MKLPFMLTLLFFLFIFRALLIILHELGHAIAALLLTREKVTIYIGSYGEPEKNIHFRIGLLEVFLHYKTIWVKNGLCKVSKQNIPINHQIIYLICGPVFPFFISILLYNFLLRFLSENNLQLYLFYIQIFILFAVIDLFRNLIPRSKPIDLYNGTRTYNDGQNIKILLKSKDFYPKYMNAINFYNAKEYLNAITLFDELLNKYMHTEEVYRLNISANLQIKNYEKAKILNDDFMTKFQLNSIDYTNAGVIYSRFELAEKSLEYYEKALELDGNNVYALNNKGYCLNLVERYEEAIPFFDKAIEINKSFAYSYNNRGLSKIKTVQVSEGLLDIQESMKLDKNNSYNYRNLGIYHLDLDEKNKALELFIKARELDCDTDQIDKLILQAKNWNKQDYISPVIKIFSLKPLFFSILKCERTA